jgi:hypothetical protein
MIKRKENVNTLTPTYIDTSTQYAKKGQLTLFLVIALTLILLSGVVLFLASSATTQSTSTQRVTLNDQVLNTIEIKAFITSCIEQAANDAFYRIGQQGGTLTRSDFIPKYESHGAFDKVIIDENGQPIPERIQFQPGINGIIHDTNTELHTLHYAIKSPSFTGRTAHPPPPNYPYKGSLTSAPTERLDPFGHADLASAPPTNINALCNYGGVNNRTMLGANYSCEDTLYAHTKTSQDFLQSYIKQQLELCVDSQFYRDLTNISLTFSPEGKVDVLFADNYSMVLVDYPIAFTFPSGKTTTEVFEFATLKQIRYKLIHELAFQLAKRDIQDIFFSTNNQEHIESIDLCAQFQSGPTIESIARTKYNIPCLYPNMSVHLERDACSFFCKTKKGQGSTILTIKDNLSLVDDKPFQFKLAIENRPPALDHIDESVTNDIQIYPYSKFQGYYYHLLDKYGVTPESAYSKTLTSLIPDNYNIVIMVGDKIDIYPRAIDPDDDTITYSYSGWRTPTPICDLTSASGSLCNDQDTSLTSNNPSGFIYKDTKFSPAKEGTITSGGTQNSQGYTTHENEWELSPEYINNQQDASYITSSFDTGYHYVRIKATDFYGNYDFQDVKIQVRCDPNDPINGGCCNTANDFTPFPAGTKGSCSSCQSCSEYGVCVIDDNQVNDCSACNICSSGSCTTDDADTLGLCTLKDSTATCTNGLCTLPDVTST